MNIDKIPIEGSFLINNKRVWMKEKPKDLQDLDMVVRKERNISPEVDSIISIFLPNGSIWPIDFKKLKANFSLTALISTKNISDINGKMELEAFNTRYIIPNGQIYRFKVNGYLIMIDYIKEDYQSEKSIFEQELKSLTL